MHEDIEIKIFDICYPTKSTNISYTRHSEIQILREMDPYMNDTKGSKKSVFFYSRFSPCAGKEYRCHEFLIHSCTKWTNECNLVFFAFGYSDIYIPPKPYSARKSTPPHILGNLKKSEFKVTFKYSYNLKGDIIWNSVSGDNKKYVIKANTFLYDELKQHCSIDRTYDDYKSIMTPDLMQKAYKDVDPVVAQECFEKIEEVFYEDLMKKRDEEIDELLKEKRRVTSETEEFYNRKKDVNNSGILTLCHVPL